MTEHWKTVPGYPEYEVSDLGAVRRGSKLLAGARDWKGYRYASLRNAEGRRQFSVHSLVLTVFVSPRPEGLETRHLNGDCTDNRLSNLAWGTRSENARDRVRHGTQRNRNTDKLRCAEGHPLEGQNLAVDRLGRSVCRFCANARRRVRYMKRRARLLEEEVDGEGH